MTTNLVVTPTERPDTSMWFEEREKRLLTIKPMVLYHQTSAAIASTILKSGFTRHTGGKAGDGIYFANSVAATYGLTEHRGVTLECLVLLGNRHVDKLGRCTNWYFTDLLNKGYDSVHLFAGSAREEFIVYNYDQVVVVTVHGGRKRQFTSDMNLARRFFTGGKWDVQMYGAPLSPYKLAKGSKVYTEVADKLQITLRDRVPPVCKGWRSQLVSHCPLAAYHAVTEDEARQILANGYKKWDTAYGRALCFDLDLKTTTKKLGRGGASVLMGVVILPGASWYPASKEKVKGLVNEDLKERGCGSVRVMTEDGEQLVLFKKNQVLFAEPLNWQVEKLTPYGRVGEGALRDDLQWGEYGAHDIYKLPAHPGHGLKRYIKLTRRDVPDGFPSSYKEDKARLLRLLEGKVIVLYHVAADGEALKGVAAHGLSTSTRLLVRPPSVKKGAHVVGVVVFAGKLGTDVTKEHDGGEVAYKVADEDQMTYFEVLSGAPSIKDSAFAASMKGETMFTWFRRLYVCGTTEVAGGDTSVKVELDLNTHEPPTPDTYAGVKAAISARRLDISGKEFSLTADEMIATGGYSTVYRGDYEGEEVVVKWVLDNHIFTREARILLKLKDSNAKRHISKVHGFIIDKKKGDGIVMKSYKCDLLAYVTKVMQDMTGGERLEVAKGLMVQITKAVLVVHGEDIIHRDLKPENILVEEGPEGPVIALCDFGISKNMITAMITRNVKGTLHYLAPEMHSGNPECTKATDAFALGWVFHFLLCGKEAKDAEPVEGSEALWSLAEVLTHEKPEQRSEICAVLERLGRVR